MTSRCLAACRSVQVVALAAVATTLVAPSTVAAQEPVKFAEPDPARFPANTLVARYRIDPAVLETVTTTDELVEALRANLMVEASMPLDEPLRVNLRGSVHSPSVSNSYGVQSTRFSFAMAGLSSVSSHLATAVKTSQEAEMFPDWEEDEAWSWLVQALDDALADPTSMVTQANGVRPKNDAGHVPIRIAAVHVLPYGPEAFDLADAFERDYIELSPGPRFASSAMAGWEAPENFTYETQLIYLELEPAEAQPLVTMALSAEALDRFVGNYEMQPGVLLEVWRNGSDLDAAPSERKDEVKTFTPISETEFSSGTGGDLVTFTFSIGDDGAVESVTMTQGGFSMTMPRVR